MDVDEVAHVLGIVFCRAPLGEFDLAPGTMNVEENEEIDRAVATILVIAMRYFDLPPDSAEYASVEKFAAEAIMDEWKLGVRHKIVLANKAIAVIEDRHPLANELRRVRKTG
jgi:hypothetical protein